MRPHEVRIIGGRFRRTRLAVADRPGLRPTPDRVRETLFNWLGQDLAGWRCLDAFAGSGALGLEAASRGAGHVLMIERDPSLASMLKRAVQRLDASTVEVVCADAIDVLARQSPGTFDLVLLDPPYASDLLAPALRKAAELVTATGFLYLESAAPPEPPTGWGVVRQLRAGAVHAALLVRCPQASPTEGS